MNKVTARLRQAAAMLALLLAALISAPASAEFEARSVDRFGWHAPAQGGLAPAALDAMAEIAAKSAPVGVETDGDDPDDAPLLPKREREAVRGDACRHNQQANVSRPGRRTRANQPRAPPAP